MKAKQQNLILNVFYYLCFCQKMLYKITAWCYILPKWSSLRVSIRVGGPPRGPIGPSQKTFALHFCFKEAPLPYRMRECLSWKLSIWKIELNDTINKLYTGCTKRTSISASSSRLLTVRPNWANWGNRTLNRHFKYAYGHDRFSFLRRPIKVRQFGQLDGPSKTLRPRLVIIDGLSVKTCFRFSIIDGIFVKNSFRFTNWWGL